MDLKFIFLLGVTILLWLVPRIIKKNKGWHNFFVVIFSIFITLVVIETTYRFILKKNAFTIKSNKNFGAYTNHPLTGFMIADAGEMLVTKIARNGDTIFNTIYTLIPDSGAHSIQMNHRSSFNNKTGNDTAEFVFFGCSIAYGEGIRDTETFAYVTGERCNTSSLNYAFSGFGTHQAYNIYLNKYKGFTDQKKRTFVYSFIPDHILRAKCIYPWNINDPYFELVNDSLVLKGKATDNSGYAKTHRLTRYLSLFNAFTFITDIETSVVTGKAAKELQQHDYDRTFRMIQSMQKSIAANNDNLIFLYWDKYKWKEADDSKILNRSLIEQEIENLRKLGVTVVKASEAFDINNSSFFIKGDGHPTAEANKLVAALLAKNICNK
ncbi:MAG: hypothetical protein ACKVOW_02620 [Chitinophagaceae bacterium]